MKNIKKHIFGFTLIELMTVMVIVGILATVSIPAYQPYIKRTRIVEALELSSPLKKEITDYYDYYGVMPKDNQALFLATPELLQGKKVKSIEVENGAIHITIEIIPEKLDVVSIRPVIFKETSDILPIDYMLWVVGNCSVDFVPENMEVIGINKTTVDEEFIKC